MNQIHGGDIYRNRVELDFSVNVNPLGIPVSVKAALHQAVGSCRFYPDPEAESLRNVVSTMLDVPGEQLLFGNGASELFMAVVHALRPKKIAIPVPSFYGYEYAAKASGSKITYILMKEKEGFLPGRELFDALTEDTDLLFLANPNNPTGGLLTREYLERVLEHCRRKQIAVILDECFIEFCTQASGRQEPSTLSLLPEYENLILVRAFTKSFAVPGVRLGYLACSSKTILQQIRCQLPEWNLSVFAQAAGIACAGEQEFLRQAADYVREERRFLEEGFTKLGFRVYPGTANFLLIHMGQMLCCPEKAKGFKDKPLEQQLLERGILIRNCENFRGLGTGYYRIAVKCREENERLLKVMGELCGAR